MSDHILLADAKRALRITDTEYNAEIERQIYAAIADLAMVNVDTTLIEQAAVKQAILTYVCANFGNPPNYAALKAAYDEQKAQLMVSSTYRVNGGAS